MSSCPLFSSSPLLLSPWASSTDPSISPSSPFTSPFFQHFLKPIFKPGLTVNLFSWDSAAYHIYSMIVIIMNL